MRRRRFLTLATGASLLPLSWTLARAEHSGPPSVPARQLLAQFLAQPSDGEKHYKEACAWYGALQVAELLPDPSALAALVRRYDPYFETYAELLGGEGHVDNNVWGIVPLQIYRTSRDPRHLEDGLALADHQRAHLAAQTRWAIDDLFMITALQVQAFRATGDTAYLDTLVPLVIRYLERLQQPDGTFHHHEDVAIRWCRGNGWVASGLTELLRSLPPDFAGATAVRAGYQAMMAGLLAYRIPEGQPGAGLWRQVLDLEIPGNWPETSGSAMFTNALMTGVAEGWLDRETYDPVAETAWRALLERLEPDGSIRDVSNWMWKGEVEKYIQRERLTGDNHGQAPMLWGAATRLRAGLA